MVYQKHFHTLLIVGFCVGFVLLLAACAPRTGNPTQQTSGEGDEQDSVVQIDWTPQSDCQVCHTVEADSFANQVCLAAKHSDASCVSCHTDEAKLKQAHDGKTTADAVPKRLKVTAVAPETCTDPSCHATSDYAQLAQLTTGSTVLTDSRGTTVNPHEAPGLTAAHAAQNMQCLSCHTIHSTTPEKDAQDYCYSCHHHKVYECGTCHTVT
jgi:hypothetical protein